MRILTSLAEKDYFLGLAALINSIVKNGTYIDKCVIGYRDKLPDWLPPLQKTNNGMSCKLQSGIELELILLESDLHMVHEKPKWFKHLVEVLEPEAEEYFFFDSDIVVLNRMNFFGEWVKQGVALCGDVNYDMDVTHPIRKQWQKLGELEGLKTNKSLNRYYNSGFLGWTKETSSFIFDWEKSFSVLSKKSGNMKKFRVHDRTNVVLSANQDSFNLAAMITEMPISAIGPEAMGFEHGLKLMSHPIGPKPWNRSFINDFIKGNPPRQSDIIFWEHINGTEFQPVSNLKVKWNIVVCKTLRAMARFYRRLS